MARKRKERYTDLIGKKFDTCVVVSGPEYRTTTPTSVNPNGRNIAYWRVACSSCGNERWMTNSAIMNSVSCECKVVESGIVKMDKPKEMELIGMKFGDFTVIGPSRIDRNRRQPRREAPVRCVCGREMWKYVVYLKRGEVTNCGCRKGAKQVERAERLRRNATRAEEVPAMFSIYRRNAQKRGYDFNLSLEDVIRLTAGDCEYCGAPPSRPAPNRRQDSGLRYNGIDRIDNAIGYTVENCVPCCSECNVSKNTSTVESFIDWVKRVYTHLAEKENPLPAPSLSPLQWAVQ